MRAEISVIIMTIINSWQTDGLYHPKRYINQEWKQCSAGKLTSYWSADFFQWFYLSKDATSTYQYLSFQGLLSPNLIRDSLCKGERVNKELLSKDSLQEHFVITEPMIDSEKFIVQPYDWETFYQILPKKLHGKIDIYLRKSYCFWLILWDIR